MITKNAIYTGFETRCRVRMVIYLLLVILPSICYSSSGPSSYWGVCGQAIRGSDVIVGGIVVTQRVLSGRAALARGGEWCEAIVNVDHILKGRVGSQLRIQYFNGEHTMSTNYEMLTVRTRYVLCLNYLDATNSICVFSTDGGAVLETPMERPVLPKGEISFAERMDIELAATMKHKDALCRFRAVNSIDRPWFGNRTRTVLPTLTYDKDKDVRTRAGEVLSYLTGQSQDALEKSMPHATE